MYFGAAFWPTDAAADLIAGFTAILTDNLPVILGVLAFSWGIKFVMKLLNKSTKGRV